MTSKRKRGQKEQHKLKHTQSIRFHKKVNPLNNSKKKIRDMIYIHMCSQPSSAIFIHFNKSLIHWFIIHFKFVGNHHTIPSGLVWMWNKIRRETFHQFYGFHFDFFFGFLDFYATSIHISRQKKALCREVPVKAFCCFPFFNKTSVQ